MTKLAVAKIVLDESIYPRSGVSDFNVNRLMNAIKSGAKLPPIIVETKTLRCVDGRHRLEAHKRLDHKTIDATEKSYKNEAALFADAVRLNIGHGSPLDLYTVRNAIIRLEVYGYSREAIAEVVRMPVESISKIERGFASDDAGKPIALKGGLSHLAGQQLDPQQLAINKKYSGGKAVFYVRQITGLLANEMYPPTKTFESEMDSLCDLWRKVKTKGVAA